MPTIGTTTRPAYVYDAETDTWIPVGTGPHTHTGFAISDVTGLQAALDAELSLTNYNAGAKNFVVNGGMDFFQRGTTFTTSGAYCADRWLLTLEGGPSCTATQVTSSLPTGLVNALRVQRNAGNATTGTMGISQALETASSIPLQGRTITLSFWARAGANYSTTNNTLSIRINSGTGTNQAASAQFGGWTGYAESAPDVQITTSWARYSGTFNVPSNATQIGVRIFSVLSGTAGAADFFEVTGVQLELGSTPTAFSRAGGTIQGEHAACLYYFNRVIDYSAGGSNANQTIMVAQNFASTGGFGAFPYPKMRINPTVTFSSQTDFIITGAAGNEIATTALEARNIKVNSCELRYTVASGLTTGNAAFMYTKTTLGRIDLSAEL